MNVAVWPVVFFGKVLNHLGRYSALAAIITTFVAWITGLVEEMVLAAIQQLQNLVNALSMEGMGNVNFAALPAVGVVNAIMPLSEMATVLILFGTIWVTVIVIRWIKSFVPTVGN